MHSNSRKNINKRPRVILLTPFVGVNRIFHQEELYKLNSSLASDRLQIKPLIKALHNLGYNTSAASLNTTFHLKELDQFQDFDLCIASKMRSHESMDDNIFSQFHTCCALYLKRNGAKLITIYSDHVAKLKSVDSELYKNLLYLSDHIVTPSKKLCAQHRDALTLLSVYVCVCVCVYVNVSVCVCVCFYRVFVRARACVLAFRACLPSPSSVRFR